MRTCSYMTIYDICAALSASSPPPWPHRKGRPGLKSPKKLPVDWRFDAYDAMSPAEPRCERLASHRRCVELPFVLHPFATHDPPSPQRGEGGRRPGEGASHAFASARLPPFGAVSDL